MARKLASIQRIKEIKPIADADRIEALKILGWTVVSQKDLHDEGGYCVYCEIDSIMPIKYFPDLEKYGCRINTIKLRGQISQGFCIPMNTFFEIAKEEGYTLQNDAMCLNLIRDNEIIPIVPGQEVTDVLGITKWEPPAHLLEGDFCGSFPSHLMRVTEETRIQSCPELVEEMQGQPYVITVKCDGESGSYINDFGEFCACAHENKRTDGDNMYWNIARRYKIKEILDEYPTYGIQGELCGPGIRKNRLGLTEVDYFVFNIVDIETRTKLSYDKMIEFTTKVGLNPVPLFLRGDNFDFTFEDLLLLADGHYEGTKNWREGIVIRHADYGIQSESLKDWMSFKIISNKYLLKGGE